MPDRANRLFQFGGLADLLHFLDWAWGLANTPERLSPMAYDFCERLQKDGTRYADVIVNPTHWRAWRGRTKAMIEALDRGFTWPNKTDFRQPGSASACCAPRRRTRRLNSSNDSSPGDCLASSGFRSTATRPPPAGRVLGSPKPFGERALRASATVQRALPAGRRACVTRSSSSKTIGSTTACGRSTTRWSRFSPNAEFPSAYVRPPTSL